MPVTRGFWHFSRGCQAKPLFSTILLWRGTTQDMFFLIMSIKVSISIQLTCINQRFLLPQWIVYHLALSIGFSLNASPSPTYLFSECLSISIGRSQPPMLMEMVHALHLVQPDDNWLVEVGKKTKIIDPKVGGWRKLLGGPGAPGWQRNDGYYDIYRPNPKTAFWMIHVKDSRSYHWAKFGLWVSWIMKYIVKIDHVYIYI